MPDISPMRLAFILDMVSDTLVDDFGFTREAADAAAQSQAHRVGLREDGSSCVLSLVDQRPIPGAHMDRIAHDYVKLEKANEAMAEIERRASQPSEYDRQLQQINAWMDDNDNTGPSGTCIGES